MMTMRESIICVTIVPGVVAGLSLGYTNANYDLSWWAMGFVGLGGWIAGFILAAACGTILERWKQHP